jgi:outer membrane immunogenic protein
MMHRWLIGAAAALVVAGAVSAQAADLPTRKEAPVPVFVAPPFTWTGFYLGVNAGGIFGSGGNASTTFAGSGAFGIPFTILTTNWPNNNGFGSSKTGFIGGGQAGYNWQTGSWVFGVETDFDGSTLSRSRTVIGPTFADPFRPLGTDFFTANGSARLDWLGSTRGRVGFAWDRLLIYGTGGVAYGGASGNLNIFDANNGWFWSSGNRSNTRTGWAAGGGVEYAFTNNIILGAEYLFYDLGSRNFALVPSPAATAFFGTPVFSQTKINFDASVVRARLSYKF